MAKIGDKFIIELAVECPSLDNNKSFILKNTKGLLGMVKESTLDGFEKWDEQSAIKQLEEFSKGVSDDIEAAYRRGLNDAWKLTQKIFCFVEDGGMKSEELRNAFGTGVTAEIAALPIEKVMSTLTTYETKKKAEEIKVGDEVSSNMIRRGIVTRVDNYESGAWCYVMGSGGSSCSTPMRNLRKTGKYFPQVAELLAAMEEDGDTDD